MLIGANRKTLCINRVLISLLPRYSIMKHTAKVRQATFTGGDGAGGSRESTFSSYDEKLL